MKKIIVVDDNKDIDYTLDAVFEHLDEKLDVSFAFNGEECLKLVKDKFPDLIIMDIMMPGIDGFETVKRIKQDKKFKNVPVIFLTALTDVKTQQKAKKYGHFMEKPFDLENFNQTVKTLLNVAD